MFRKVESEEEVLISISKIVTAKKFKRVPYGGVYGRDDFFQEVFLRLAAKKSENRFSEALEKRESPILMTAGLRIGEDIIEDWARYKSKSVTVPHPTKEVISALRAEFPSLWQEAILLSMATLNPNQRRALTYEADGASEFGARMMGITQPAFRKAVNVSARKCLERLWNAGEKDRIISWDIK